MIEVVRHKLQFTPFHIFSDVDLLYCGDSVVPLPPNSVRVLRYLAEHCDRVVSKVELLDRIWPDVFTTDNVLKKAVLLARRALGDDGDGSHSIKTYHRRGYQFVRPVQISSLAEGEACDKNFNIASVNTLQPEWAEQKRTTTGPNYDQLVGREDELTQLRFEFGRMLKGAGQPTFISGEPGIGKTQLARYFGQWAREQGAISLYARFVDYTASRLAPYEIFLDLLRSALDVGRPAHKGYDQFDLRALAETNLGVTLPEELFSGAIALTRPTHVEGSAGDHFRAVVPVSTCLVRLSRQRPLVIVIDDLQWADDASLDLLGYLMRIAQREPLMLVALARTEETEDQDHPLNTWLKRQATYRTYTSLALTLLDERACVAAIEATFGASCDTMQIPPLVTKALYETTGGNPYFLTEMLRLLVAEGAVTCRGEERPRWRGVEDLRLPQTIVMATSAKLDRLPKEVLELAEQASVIGDEFRLETLSLVAQRNEEEIEQLLGEAVQRGILSRRALSTGEDYRFHHPILRRVLYDRLSPRCRKLLHARTAHALELVYACEADRVAGGVSAHHEAAGNLLQTFEWGMRAWHAASSRWHWTEAVTAIERAHRAMSGLDRLEQNELGSVDRLKLLLGLSEGYCLVGRLKESESAMEVAVGFARSLDDQPLVAATLLQQGLTQSGLGLRREAMTSTEQALQIYRELNDQKGMSLALVQVGTFRIAMGDYEKSPELIEQALKHIEAGGVIETRALGTLGWARVLQGYYERGLPLLEQALARHDRAGDVRQRALTLRRLHWAQLSRGDYEAAIRLACRARDDFRTVGDVNGEAKMNMAIGQARIAQGLYEEGIELLDRTLEVLKVIGDTHCEAESLWLLGRAYVELGRANKAELLLTRSLDMVREIGDRDDQFRILTDIARLKLSQEDYVAGLAAADQAVEIAEELHNRDGLGVALVERARACLSLKQPRKALDAAERAVNILEETESGERWRAYRTLALIYDLPDEKKTPRHKQRPLAALRRSVELLHEIREQIETSDAVRRARVIHAHSEPARDLHAMLLRFDLKAEAEVLSKDWLLDEPDIKHHQLELATPPRQS